jgi:hypothetical protein
MSAWLTYLKERFPLPVYLLLVGGFSLSGLLVGGGEFATGPFAVSFGGMMLFFWLLRLMDELKDYAKDRIGHPERPLPRGLLGTGQVERAIRFGGIAMVGWSAGAALLANVAAGSCYLVVTAYLWLMYREFYCGGWLEQRPLFYALTHQVILFPLCYFCVLVARPELIADPLPFYFALCTLGAFFAYEVCRKLDPQAHPVLGTYLVVYGAARTFVIVLAATVVAGSGAVALGLHHLLLPVQGVVLLSLAVLWLKPGAYKIPETVAGVSLLLHLWAVPLQVLVCGMAPRLLCGA